MGVKLETAVNYLALDKGLRLRLIIPGVVWMDDDVVDINSNTRMGNNVKIDL